MCRGTVTRGRAKDAQAPVPPAPDRPPNRLLAPERHTCLLRTFTAAAGGTGNSSCGQATCAAAASSCAMHCSLLNTAVTAGDSVSPQGLTCASVRRIWVEPLAAQNMQIVTSCGQLSGQAAGEGRHTALMADKDPRRLITIASRPPPAVRGRVDGGGGALPALPRRRFELGKAQGYQEIVLFQSTLHFI